MGGNNLRRHPRPREPRARVGEKTYNSKALGEIAASMMRNTGQMQFTRTALTPVTNLGKQINARISDDLNVCPLNVAYTSFGSERARHEAVDPQPRGRNDEKQT